MKYLAEGYFPIGKANLCGLRGRRTILAVVRADLAIDRGGAQFLRHIVRIGAVKEGGATSFASLARLDTAFEQGASGNVAQGAGLQSWGGEGALGRVAAVQHLGEGERLARGPRESDFRATDLDDVLGGGVLLGVHGIWFFQFEVRCLAAFDVESKTEKVVGVNRFLKLSLCGDIDLDRGLELAAITHAQAQAILAANDLQLSLGHFSQGGFSRLIHSLASGLHVLAMLLGLLDLAALIPDDFSGDAPTLSQELLTIEAADTFGAGKGTVGNTLAGLAWRNIIAHPVALEAHAGSLVCFEALSSSF